MPSPTASDDCWDAFGSDDEDEQESNECTESMLWLTQHFVRWNPQISLAHRRVSVLGDSDGVDEWKAALQARPIQVIATPSELVDAAIVVGKSAEARSARPNVVPNGALMLVGTSSTDFDDRVWSKEEEIGDSIKIRIKHSCPINELACPWLPSTHGASHERSLLAEATVTRSAVELSSKTPQSLSQHDLQRASSCLTKYGYCVVRNLVDPVKCLEWGSAALNDLQVASDILSERDGIEIKSSGVETSNYRELAMREDLRMDLRDGPNLRRLRQQESKHYQEWGIDPQANSSAPIVTTSRGGYDSCLRFHPDVLQIVKQTMNPNSGNLYKGNFGRYNFDGSGPDGSFQPLRIGPMGAIVSFPGSADQALHADTPHLFEHDDCLPAHYINAFCLGISDVRMEVDGDGCATGDTPVGGTVFVHESHRLSFTAEMEYDRVIGNTKLQANLVRPSLQLGDVVLFDCRILHFGLANNSADIERPLLYTNMTHAWFHDPKNWDDRQRVFDYDTN